MEQSFWPKESLLQLVCDQNQVWYQEPGSGFGRTLATILYDSAPRSQRSYFAHPNLHIIIDEDMAGDYLLAEAKFPLNQVLPQMQKKFQICLEKPDLRVSLMLTR